MTSALPLYDRALRGGGELHVHFDDGGSFRLPVDRYLGPADSCDAELLDGVRGPVLDVGCGPGRHLRALTARDVFALGVDLSPAAVSLACGDGARAIVGDVFDELPGAGTWRTALLLDGNIGIGGSPRRLLARLRLLLHARGVVLAEVDPPGSASGTTLARVEHGKEVSGWFPWGRVSVSQIESVATSAGFTAAPPWSIDDRWFVRLSPA